MKQNDPIAESRRYVENARETLREHGQLDVEQIRYQDEKYVKAAGNYLWGGVLIALDAVFHVRKNEHDRVDIKDYRKAVGNRDRKLLGLVNNGYETIHLYMNYDGAQDKVICDNGFRLANGIIDRCAIMLYGTTAPAA